MGDETDLTLKLRLDRSEADASLKMFGKEAKGVEKEVLAAVKQTEAAKTAIGKATNQERIRDDRGRWAAVKAGVAEEIRGTRAVADAHKAASRDASEAARRSSQETAAGIKHVSGIAIGAAHSIASGALSEIKQFVGEIGNAIKKAETDARRMTVNFGDQRAQLVELAQLQGKQADNKFTLDFAGFNQQTGLTPQQSLAFQSSYLNSGAQYKGVSLSDAEHEQFMLQAAKLAVAKGIDPGVVGDLAGRMLGVRDYSKFKDQGSEQALGDLNQLLAVESSGSGEAPQLGRETTKLMAASVSEDDLRGVLKSPKDAAKLISVLSEGFPEGQAEAAQALIRGMRDVRGYAKITAEDDPFEALKKLAPVVQAEAKEKGVKVQDILNQHVKEELSQRAIAVAINKGELGGLFAAREETARANAGPDVAMGVIATGDQLEAVRQAKADAAIRQAEMKRGAENSELEIRRREALARLIDSRKINTTATGVGDYIKGRTQFGLLGDVEQQRIDEEVAAELKRQGGGDFAAPAAEKGWGRWAVEKGLQIGFGGGSPQPDIGPPSPSRLPPEQREQILNEQIERLKAKAPAGGAMGEPFNPEAGGGEIGRLFGGVMPGGLFPMMPGSMTPEAAAPAPGPGAMLGGDTKELVALLSQIRDRLPERRVGPQLQSRPIVDTRMG